MAPGIGQAVGYVNKLPGDATYAQNKTGYKIFKYIPSFFGNLRGDFMA